MELSLKWFCLKWFSLKRFSRMEFSLKWFSLKWFSLKWFSRMEFSSNRTRTLKVWLHRNPQGMIAQEPSRNDRTGTLKEWSHRNPQGMINSYVSPRLTVMYHHCLTCMDQACPPFSMWPAEALPRTEYVKQCKQCLLSRPFHRLAPSDCVGGVARQVQCCRAGWVIYNKVGNSRDGWSVRAFA
jgi:hypothetical protein